MNHISSYSGLVSAMADMSSAEHLAPGADEVAVTGLTSGMTPQR